jgi:hypothetical protein
VRGVHRWSHDKCAGCCTPSASAPGASRRRLGRQAWVLLLYGGAGPPPRQQLHGFPSLIYDGAAFDNDEIGSMAAVVARVLLDLQQCGSSSKIATTQDPPRRRGCGHLQGSDGVTQ